MNSTCWSINDCTPFRTNENSSPRLGTDLEELPVCWKLIICFQQQIQSLFECISFSIFFYQYFYPTPWWIVHCHVLLVIVLQGFYMYISCKTRIMALNTYLGALKVRRGDALFGPMSLQHEELILISHWLCLPQQRPRNVVGPSVASIWIQNWVAKIAPAGI